MKAKIINLEDYKKEHPDYYLSINMEKHFTKVKTLYEEEIKKEKDNNNNHAFLDYSIPVNELNSKAFSLLKEKIIKYFNDLGYETRIRPDYYANSEVYHAFTLLTFW